jgi:hypothetical protein
MRVVARRLQLAALRMRCGKTRTLAVMRGSFLEYSAAMIGCYSALPTSQREALHAWERQHVDGSGEYGTSDWPGWIPYIGKYEPEPPSPTIKAGMVYLIQERSGLCKIGSSRNLEQRMTQLQCANPHELRLLHHFASSQMLQDERKLHTRFLHRRVKNEWFALTEADIADIQRIQRSTVMGSKDDG